MLVGEGRAGKTALANAFMGVPFVHTESTCGINQFSVEVAHAVVGSGWHPCEAAASELDAAIIALAKAKHDRPQPKASRIDEALHVASTARSSPTVDGGDAGLSPPLEFKSFPDQKIEHLRATLLNDNIFGGSDLMVQLFDFAGQDVFSCLHSYFLTRHGVYAIVFDMNWLSSTSSGLQGALEYLAFWINSVAMNTRTDDKAFAPIFLVGTHKDQVSDAAEHARISKLVDTTFSYSVAWPSVVEDEYSGLVYFPVDCTMGANDPTISRLMSQIEKSIRASRYVSIKRPLPWYDALDKLVKQTPMISLSAATEIVLQCKVSPNKVTELLEFLRDMGVIMWYNEPEIKEVVILDPVEYFVKSVTKVICQPNAHNADAHHKCRKIRREEYDVLFNTGFAIPGILHDLLSYDGHCADTLTSLMLKYGLATRWPVAGLDGGAADSVAVEKYLIPSLFPDLPSCPTSRKWAEDEPVRTFYMAFSLSKTLGKEVLKDGELAKVGFLPKGMFDRLLCSALSWCREASNNGTELTEFTLCKSFAILHAAGVWFRIVLIPAHHCIRIDVEEKTETCFNTVVMGIWNIWKAVVASGVQALTMAPFIPFVGEVGRCELLVPMALFKAPFCAGVHATVKPSNSRYHCFLSYRWDDLDKLLVTVLHSYLKDFLVNGCKMRIFFDDATFKIADRLQKVFIASVVATEVFVPVISLASLKRMINYNEGEVDNLLMEWLTIILIDRFPALKTELGSPLKFISPICIKGGYFAVKGSISSKAPKKTIAELKAIFSTKNVTLFPELLSYLEAVTVRDIVDGIMGSNCKEKVFTGSISHLVHQCGEEILRLFLPANKIQISADVNITPPLDAVLLVQAENELQKIIARQAEPATRFLPIFLFSLAICCFAVFAARYWR
jgi:GTPase SAR1 family protein